MVVGNGSTRGIVKTATTKRKGAVMVAVRVLVWAGL
jgi:hypothetical protein